MIQNLSFLAEEFVISNKIFFQVMSIKSQEIKLTEQFKQMNIHMLFIHKKC